MCILNIRSFTNPLHCTTISDLTQIHNIHVFSLAETWISPYTTFARLFDAIPHGFSFISSLHHVLSLVYSPVLGFLVLEPCKLTSSPTATFKSFEISTLVIKLPQTNLALYNIYRPP